MSKDHEPNELGFLDALALAGAASFGIGIVKEIWRRKREEWRERAEYLRSEDGLRERIDSRQELTKAEAYAARKRFEALVDAGFTEEQALGLMMSSEGRTRG